MRAFVPVLALVLCAGFAPPSTLSVAYAASLVRAMEGPEAQAFFARTHVRFAGEPGGSKALERLIAGGLRTPDVFLSADPRLLEALRRSAPPLLRRYVIFGSARMVVAYSPRSPAVSQFEAAARGKRSLLGVLSEHGIRVGRTDPQLDPKGEYTIRSLHLLGRSERRPDLAARVLRNAPEFPEEDLAVRVESGELDAGFFYSTEIPGRGLRSVDLPGGANLDGQIQYAVGALNGANRKAAREFIRFLLAGEGRRILESAGLRYFAHPRYVGPR